MATSGSFNTTDYEGRYLRFAWALQSQSYDNNNSVIAWTLTGAGQGSATWYKAGNFKVTINGVVVYLSATRINLYNGTQVASGTLTIAHENDGTKTFSVSAEAAIHVNEVNVSGSDSYELPAINRYASITSAPDFTDEDNPLITYINPLGNDADSLQACISLDSVNPLIAYRDIDKTKSNYTFELTSSERATLRSEAADSNTLTVYFVVKTVIDGQTYTSTLSSIMSIVNATPNIRGITYQDTNATTTAITGDSRKIVQNKSTLRISATNINAYKAATLVSVTITINDVTKTASLSGSSLNNFNYDFGTIDIAGGNTYAEITVTDSRGNTYATGVLISTYAWQEPTAIISCDRQNGYLSDTDLTVSGFYDSLGGNNSLTLQYQYKEHDGDTWSTLTTITSGISETLTLDNTKAWQVRVIAADLLGSTTYIIAVSVGTPLVFYDRYKRSIGVNCFPKYENSLEVNGDDPFNYHEGDTVEFTDYTLSGIALSTTAIAFTIPLDKNIGENDISFSALALSVRSAGQAADYPNFLNNGSLSISKASETSVTVVATISGTTYPVTADSIIGVIITGTLSFTVPTPITWDYELSNVDFDGTASSRVYTGINPFSTANIGRNFEIILNAETTQTAENKTDIGVFSRYNTQTPHYNLELGIRPSQTYIDRHGAISGSETTSNVGSSGKDVTIVKSGTGITISVAGTTVWSGTISNTTGNDSSQEMTVGGVTMGSTYHFLGHLNYFKFRFTS